jgi:hypothetical protein
MGEVLFLLCMYSDKVDRFNAPIMCWIIQYTNPSTSAKNNQIMFINTCKTNAFRAVNA